MSDQAAPRRILVTDAVPMNGGDELLLRALLRALHERWPSASIAVMTADVVAARALLPSVSFVGDLLTSPDEARRAYACADLVVSTPGGFLNRHYGFASRLDGFRLARTLQVPLVLFAQSIGPFDDAAQRAAIGEALSAAAVIAVRDRVSVAHLSACGLQAPQVVEVPDAAFLWPARVGRRDPGQPARRVGLCLRRWPRDDTHVFRDSVRKTRQVMSGLAAHGIEEFVFVSTCQGLPGYVDDADLSRRVLAGLAPALAARTTVHDARLTPDAFMDVAGECDFFIGMRLHACLMAMLAGTPALGLAYEDKTPQIFEQLGLGCWQLPFTRPAARWMGKALALRAALPDLRASLPGKVAAQAARARAAVALLDVARRPAARQR